mgnify:CR=1 FL=1
MDVGVPVNAGEANRAIAVSIYDALMTLACQVPVASVPTEVKLEETTEELRVVPERVPASAVTVIAAVPSKDTPLIALAVARAVAVLALLVRDAVIVPASGNVSVTGNITATGSITAFYSDERLKANVQPIENALDKVNKIRGVRYTQNKLAEEFGYNDYNPQVGVIAQEVQAVLPEVVSIAPFDMDINGNSKSGENYLTVKYEKIVPLLIQAIKEQQSSIDELLQYIKDNG